jgi:hypothetical protein
MMNQKGQGRKQFWSISRHYMEFQATINELMPYCTHAPFLTSSIININAVFKKYLLLYKVDTCYMSQTDHHSSALLRVYNCSLTNNTSYIIYRYVSELSLYHISSS